MVSENKNLFIAIVDHAGTSSSPPYPLFLGKRLDLKVIWENYQYLYVSSDLVILILSYYVSLLCKLFPMLKEIILHYTM